MVGKQIAAPIESDLFDETGADLAIAEAFKYLNRRLRSKHQVKVRLQERGFETQEINDCLDYLEQTGYVDDLKFAVLFSGEKRDLQQWGDSRIIRELKKVRIDARLIEQALDSLRDGEDDQLRLANSALEARYKSGLEPDLKAQKRALGFLARKGFSSAVCYSAVRKAVAKESAVDS